MPINYAEKYSSKVDERFTLGALTNGLINNEYDWLGVSTVKVYSIPTVGLNDYSLSGMSRYGTPSELGNEAQEMTVSKDRSFTFTIDRKSYDDTQMTMEAGKALRRQIDEIVIPEVDAYRIAALVAGADKGHIVELAVTKTNAYEEFLKVQEILDNAKVPIGGRICLVTPGYHNKIKLDDSFTKRGDLATTMAINGLVGEIDGVPVVKAPASYFPANVDFVITNPIVMPSPIKLQEYKIHTDAPGISGWLVEGRVRYDAFVLKEKKSAIGVHTAPTAE
jgi:N4-gp56 family major capsid protein